LVKLIWSDLEGTSVEHPCWSLLMQEAASAQRGDEQPPTTTAAAVAVLGMHKALARTLIAQTLPAPEPALRSRIDILVDIGSSEAMSIRLLMMFLPARAAEVCWCSTPRPARRKSPEPLQTPYTSETPTDMLSRRGSRAAVGAPGGCTIQGQRTLLKPSSTVILELSIVGARDRRLAHQEAARQIQRTKLNPGENTKPWKRFTTGARDRRLAHQEAARQSQRTRAEPHPSQNLAVQRVMAQSGGQVGFLFKWFVGSWAELVRVCVTGLAV
jgi:hypothetical protein